MTVVGVTGHANLTEDSISLVREALFEHLQPYQGDLAGVTCLARGADQAFADAVLDMGGELHAVLPAQDYITGIRDPADRQRCESYLAMARSTVTLPYETSGPAAYLAASQHLIDQCDVLLAVWDGVPSTGSGGTADAVRYARERHQPVIVVWPDGARRRD